MLRLWLCQGWIGGLGMVGGSEGGKWIGVNERTNECYDYDGRDMTKWWNFYDYAMKIAGGKL